MILQLQKLHKPFAFRTKEEVRADRHNLPDKHTFKFLCRKTWNHPATLVKLSFIVRKPNSNGSKLLPRSVRLYPRRLVLGFPLSSPSTISLVRLLDRNFSWKLSFEISGCFCFLWKTAVAWSDCFVTRNDVPRPRVVVGADRPKPLPCPGPPNVFLQAASC